MGEKSRIGSLVSRVRRNSLPHHPEPLDSEEVLRVAAVTVDRAASAACREPAPPAAHTQAVLSRSVRARGIDLIAGRIRSEPVGTPLGDIARHVMKTQGVGALRADRVRLPTGVVSEPCELVEAAGPPILGGSFAPARGVFPLRLGREAVRPLGKALQASKHL